MVGGNPRDGRQENDFYATPWEATQAILLAEGNHVPHLLDEPFVGNGAIAEILKLNGKDVTGSDIVDYGYPDTKIVDFFDITNLDRGIVTNPPFNLAEDFIRHALEDLQVGYLAVLLKATFFSAACRIKLFDQHRPTMVYPLTWRLDFSGQGRPVMECAWFVWRNQNSQTTDYQLLQKPMEKPKQ